MVSRSGASTCAELAAIGRPAVLVPLPNALDQDQAANARMLATAGGAVVASQAALTPARLARELALAVADPARLTEMAGKARGLGKPDAVERLADLVEEIAAANSAGAKNRRMTAEMKMSHEIGPVHFVGIGGIGMSGIAEGAAQPGLPRPGLRHRRQRQRRSASAPRASRS